MPVHPRYEIVDSISSDADLQRQLSKNQEMGNAPAFHRSHTMPSVRPSSKKDAAPSKSYNLKHIETHESEYGSSSSPHTPEMRGDESPSQRSKKKYQIVDPYSSDDDRVARLVRHVDSDSDQRRRRYHSPEQPTVNGGLKTNQESGRRRESKNHIKEEEQQSRRAYVVSEDSDSDTATRVTSSTIRPAYPSSSDKWQSPHNRPMDYGLKAEAANGAKRPAILREPSDSYWNVRNDSNEDERRPNSSKGRHDQDERPFRPSLPTHTSAPSKIKGRVGEERGARNRPKQYQ